MDPLAGLPEETAQSGFEAGGGTEKPSPLKKTKVEPIDEELDNGDVAAADKYEHEQGDELSRKKVPITCRLGDIYAMTESDTAHFHRQLQNLDKTLSGSGGSSSTSSVTSTEPHSFSPGYYPPETDPVILARRQKEIDFGKCTPEYVRYYRTILKSSRTPDHPRTPNMKRKYSRRAWDGLVRQWRLQLHLYNKSTAELNLEMENRQREKNSLNDPFCSEASEATTASTSTTSSVFSDVRGETVNWPEEEEADKDKTLGKHLTSWFDEVEEENEFNSSQVTDDDEKSIHVSV